MAWKLQDSKSSSKSTSKKKEEHHGLFGRFVEDIADIGKGLPTGLYMTGKTLLYDPIRHPSDYKKQSKQVKDLGRAIGSGYKESVTHPLRHPGNTLLDLLGVASLGAGAVAKGASVSAKVAELSGAGARAEKLARFAQRTKRPVRTIKPHKSIVRQGRPQTKVISRRGKKMVLQNYRPVLKGAARNFEVAANPNPLVRGARKVIYDPTVGRIPAVNRFNTQRAIAQMERRSKHAMSDISTYPTVREQLGAAARPPWKKLPQGPEVKVPAWQRAMGLPANMLRATIYARPRYLAQNLPQALYFAATQGAIRPSILREVSHLKKNAPLTHRRAMAAAGEGMAKSLDIEGVGQRVGAMADVLNRPEAHIRVWTLAREAKQEGFKNLEDFIKALEANPYNARVARVMERANEATIDYGRLGSGERAFMRTQLPIFYPMYKGFSRYAARFPTHHSVQASAMGQIGQAGRERQTEDFGGAPPWYQPYLISAGKDKKSFTTLNPENLAIQSPGINLLLAGQSITRPGGPIGGSNYLQMLGPLADIMYSTNTGRELATGYEAKQEELWNPLGSLGYGIREALPNIIPGAEFLPSGTPYVGRPAPRTYENPDLMQKLLLWGFGPGYVPRKTQPGKLQKQIRQEEAERTKRRPKSKKSSGSSGGWKLKG